MRTYLITGAEQGLGYTITKLLEESPEPCQVINLPGDVIRHGRRAIGDFIHSLDPYIKITRVINNFAINHLSWIGETPEQDEDIMNINVLGPYWVINDLVARGDTARVVNIASQTYRVPQRTTALYCASKAALVHMTRVMARELAPAGWVINALAPGKITDTHMSVLTDAQVRELRGPEIDEDYARSLIPMARFTTTWEVAEAVRMLLEMPDYVNGTTLDMMGGV